MKNLATVKGRQYIDAFSETIKNHIYPIAGTINDCYNQFPKQDANKLCTKTFWQYFVKRELMVPWNIIIWDREQEGEPYAIGTQDIEIIFLFKVGTTDAVDEVVEVSLNMGTLEVLITYKKLIDTEWQPIDDGYLVTARRVQRVNRSISEYDTILDWPGKS